MLTSKPEFQSSQIKSNLQLNASYKNNQKQSTMQTVNRVWKLCISGVTKGKRSQKHVVQESSNYRVLRLSSHFILTRMWGGKIAIWQKILHLLQFLKHQKANRSKSQYCTYSIGGLNSWMKDCLATRPYKSMFLYWINTKNGHSKKWFCNDFISKTFL